MKVLVPVDGSRHSLDGVRVASSYVKDKLAAVYIMTVVPCLSDMDLELPATERDRIHEAMKSRGEEVLEKASALMRDLGVLYVKTVLSTSPSPAREIVDFADRERVDLIVMGSRGTGAAQRFPLGSTASSVASHSACCVYVVRNPRWL